MVPLLVAVLVRDVVNALAVFPAALVDHSEEPAALSCPEDLYAAAKWDDLLLALLHHRLGCRHRRRRVLLLRAGCLIEEEGRARPPPWTGRAMALCLAEPRMEVGQGAAWRACVLERREVGGLGTGLGMEGGCGCDDGGVGSWWGVGGAQVGGASRARGAA